MSIEDAQRLENEFGGVVVYPRYGAPLLTCAEHCDIRFTFESGWFFLPKGGSRPALTGGIGFRGSTFVYRTVAFDSGDSSVLISDSTEFSRITVAPRVYHGRVGNLVVQAGAEMTDAQRRSLYDLDTHCLAKLRGCNDPYVLFPNGQILGTP